jgi:hypothetical protein
MLGHAHLAEVEEQLDAILPPDLAVGFDDLVQRRI